MWKTAGISARKSIFTHKGGLSFSAFLQNYFREDFIYFNDDFTLTKKVCYSDFWTPESGYKIHTQGPIGKAKKYEAVCSEDCISVKFSDGQCDEECNTLACLWDGDDCDGVTPKGGEPDHRPGPGVKNRVRPFLQGHSTA